MAFPMVSDQKENRRRSSSPIAHYSPIHPSEMSRRTSSGRRSLTSATGPRTIEAASDSASAAAKENIAPAAAASNQPNTEPNVQYNLDTKRLKNIKKTFEGSVDKCLTATAPTSLLQALPKDLHQKHALVIQRLAEKAITSIKKNIMNEFEVILSEHRLPEKLGEIEYLEQQGGLELDDGTHSAPAASPEAAIRSMLSAARQAERARLLALAQQLEADNEELKAQITDVASSLQKSTEQVAKQQQFTNRVYELLEAEDRQ